MKITAAQIWSHLLNARKPMHAILYGPETVLLESLAWDLGTEWTQQLQSASIQIWSDITAPELQESLSQQNNLFAVSSTSLKINIIRNVLDSHKEIIQKLCNQTPTNAYFIFIGSNLTTRSKVIVAGNQWENVLCVGFYEGNVQWRNRWLRKHLEQKKSTLAQDLFTTIAQKTDDTTNFEDLVEKIILLEPTTEKGLLPLLHTDTQKLDALVWSYWQKNSSFAKNLRELLTQNPEEEMKVLRSILQAGLRLYQVSTYLTYKKDINAALDTLTPSLHFKIKDVFLRALKAWTSQKLWEKLCLLNEAEYQLKNNGKSLIYLL